MIKHIVMWKLKDFAEGENKLRNAEKIKSLLGNLRNKIDQLISIEVGININESDSAYDIVLYSEFKNKEDLGIYQNHPDHVKVVEFVGKVVENRVVVDYIV